MMKFCDTRTFRTIVVSVLACFTFLLGTGSTVLAATFDLSPTAITFNGTPIDGLPINVYVTVSNFGPDDALSTSGNPIEVRIFGDAGNIETDGADGNGISDFKSLSDGASIASGGSTTISFVWTPHVANGTTEIYARTNPRGAIDESDYSNNVISVPVTIQMTSGSVLPATLLFGGGLIGLLWISRGKLTD